MYGNDTLTILFSFIFFFSLNEKFVRFHNLMSLLVVFIYVLCFVRCTYIQFSPFRIRNVQNMFIRFFQCVLVELGAANCAFCFIEFFTVSSVGN